MQRVRMSLPYFSGDGWDATVLTVSDPTPSAPLEPELLATLHASAEIKRAFCFSRRWTRLLGVNNVALRSLPFLLLAGCRLLAGRRYDVVYFSTTMFITFPLGRVWKFLYGVPYLIDLQDPWVTDYYERPGAPRPPGGWKYRVSQGLARTLEGWTMRRVSHLITVSSAYIDALRQRHPFLNETPFTELPFGSPDLDLAYAANKLATRQSLLPAGGIRLVFAGALGPGMLPSVETLFAGIAAAKKNGLNVSAHFFGTSYSPQSESHPVTLDLAAKYGLQDCVREQPSRLRYFDALQVTLEADANLLFGSNDLAFNPSKITTVLAARKPILALVPEGSAMARRLSDLNQSSVLIPSRGPDKNCIRTVAAKLEALIKFPSNNTDSPLADRYTARMIASQQTKIFERVSVEHGHRNEVAQPNV
jgi:hypothetical protein